MNTPQTVACARRIWLRFILTGLMLSCIGRFAHGAAAPAKWTGSAEVAYVSDYLWRGFKQSGPSLQPALTATYADNLTLGIWASQGLKKDSFIDPTGNGKYGETDFLGSYSFSADPVSFTLGGTLYGIDDLTDPSSGKSFKYYFESRVSLMLKTKFSPTVTFYREFGRFKTNYVEFSLYHSLEIDKEWSISFRPYVGFFEKGNHYYGIDLSLNYEIGQQFYGRATVAPVVNNYPNLKHERVSFGLLVGRRF